MKNYTSIKILIFAFSIIWTACSSTKLVSHWTEPTTKVNIEKLHKILVIAFLKNDANRKNAEEQMVSYLKGKGVASYTYLDANFNRKNDKAWQRQIKADGFDGAVTMRLVDMEKDTVYRPGSFTSSYPSYYRNFDGFYSRNYELYNTPNLYALTRTYTVETNVYSIKEDKIIWSATTKSVGPDGVNRMTAEISKAVYKRMKKEGFIMKD